MSEALTSKDFVVEREVKWCPGCGDYSILKQVQSILPELGIPKENIVFISEKHLKVYWCFLMCNTHRGPKFSGALTLLGYPLTYIAI